MLECGGTGLNVIGGFTSLEAWTSGNACRLIAVGIWSCGTCGGASFRDGDGSEAGIGTLRGVEMVRVGIFVRLRRIGHRDDEGDLGEFVGDAMSTKRKMWKSRSCVWRRR